MLTAIRGVYSGGQVRFAEAPPRELEGCDVVITFLPANGNGAAKAPTNGDGLLNKIAQPQNRHITVRQGMFPQLADIPDEVFEAAGWYGPKEDEEW